MDYIDLAGREPDRVYALLAGLVTPRPIAWVTTVDAAGRGNAAPISFFNVMGVRPPVVVLGIGAKDDGSPKDTTRNIRDTGEFVVNLVDEPLVAAMVATARELPHGEDELIAAGVDSAPCRRVRARRVAASPASLECRLERELRIGDNLLLVGEVLAVHARAGLVNPLNLRVDGAAHAPIGRLHSPDGYCRTTDRFAVAWPE